jgi:hypothetical protein
LCTNYNISIDKVGKSKHNKTLLRCRSQKKDNMFRLFYYKAIIRSDIENSLLHLAHTKVIDMDINRDIPHIHYIVSTLTRQNLVLEL